MAAIRIIRKDPELVDQFVGRVKGLLGEKNHGVLITGVALMIDMCKADTKVIPGFRKFVPHLVRIFSSLLQYGFSPEYDVGGVTDPFLQVKILRLLRLLGEGDAETSDLMNVVLAGVATNTDNVRNVGNSILYECVNTIMGIDSEAGLRVLAINTLARFLAHRDNNIRYVALNTLCTVVNIDMEAVQRHRNTIVDCLKDNDISIRRRALELVYSLVNSVNVRVLVRELVNFLSIADIEFRGDLTAKLCIVAEKYAPTPRWQIDTILRVMTISGEYVPETTCNALLALIAQTNDIQSYAVQKMYLALTTDITQQTLVRTAVWCIGEFGDLLLNPINAGGNGISAPVAQHNNSLLGGGSNDLLSDLMGTPSSASTSASNTPQPVSTHNNGSAESEDEAMPSVRITERELIELFSSILTNIATRNSTKRQVLTALLKLTTRMQTCQADAKALIATYETHINVELQQRATEYEKILETSQLPGKLLMRIPAPELKSVIDHIAHQDHNASSAPRGGSTRAATTGGLSASKETPSAPPKPVAAPEIDLLGDLLNFGGGGGASSSTAIPDLMGGVSGWSQPPMAQTSVGPSSSSIAAPIDLLSQLSLAPSSPAASPIPFSASPSLIATGGSNASSGSHAGGANVVAVLSKQGEIALTFDFSKPQPSQPQFTLVTATFTNQGSIPITDIELKLSLPKYLKLQVLPASATTIGPHGGSSTQQIKLANTAQGEKPVMMRVRLEYKINGQPKAEQAEPSIPAGI